MPCPMLYTGCSGAGRVDTGGTDAQLVMRNVCRDCLLCIPRLHDLQHRRIGKSPTITFIAHVPFPQIVDVIVIDLFFLNNVKALSTI